MNHLSFEKYYIYLWNAWIYIGTLRHLAINVRIRLKPDLIQFCQLLRSNASVSIYVQYLKCPKETNKINLNYKSRLSSYPSSRSLRIHCVTACSFFSRRRRYFSWCRSWTHCIFSILADDSLWNLFPRILYFKRSSALRGFRRLWTFDSAKKMKISSYSDSTDFY